MYDGLLTLLLICGGSLIVLMVITMAAFTYVILREAFNEWILQYRFKHKNGKKPTANCFCEDCIFYTTETHLCKIYQEHKFPPDMFCGRGRVSS